MDPLALDVSSLFRDETTRVHVTLVAVPVDVAPGSPALRTVLDTVAVEVMRHPSVGALDTADAAPHPRSLHDLALQVMTHTRAERVLLVRVKEGDPDLLLILLDEDGERVRTRMSNVLTWEAAPPDVPAERPRVEPDTGWPAPAGPRQAVQDTGAASHGLEPAWSLPRVDALPWAGTATGVALVAMLPALAVATALAGGALAVTALAAWTGNPLYALTAATVLVPAQALVLLLGVTGALTVMPVAWLVLQGTSGRRYPVVPAWATGVAVASGVLAAGACTALLAGWAGVAVAAVVTSVVAAVSVEEGHRAWEADARGYGAGVVAFAVVCAGVQLLLAATGILAVLAGAGVANLVADMTSREDHGTARWEPDVM